MDQNITINKKVTLDLNGKNLIGDNATLSSKGDGYKGRTLEIASGADVTIKNGTISSKSAVPAGVEAEVASIKMSGTGKLTVESNATIDMNGSFAIMMAADWNGTLNMNGSTITGDAGITVNGTNKTGGTITIGNGTTINVTGTGLYLAGRSTTNITGGTITGGNAGIEIRAGVLNVSDGVFTAGGAFNEEKNDNGPTVKGAALAVSQHIEEQAITVTVNGGTFKATGSNGKALYENDLENGESNNNSEGVSITVSGGTFTGAVESKNKKMTISGGTFDSAVQSEAVAAGKTCASLKSGETSMYYVGDPAALATKLTEMAKAGDTIAVWKGNCALTGVKDGVKVKKEAGAGAVTAKIGGKDVTLNDNEEVHNHVVDTKTWVKTDPAKHWNACSVCDEKLNAAAHTFKTVVDKAATATEKGSQHEECTVCGYKKAATEIPATGTGGGTGTPGGDSASIDPTKPVVVTPVVTDSVAKVAISDTAMSTAISKAKADKTKKDLVVSFSAFSEKKDARAAEIALSAANISALKAANAEKPVILAVKTDVADVELPFEALQKALGATGADAKIEVKKQGAGVLTNVAKNGVNVTGATVLDIDIVVGGAASSAVKGLANPIAVTMDAPADSAKTGYVTVYYVDGSNRLVEVAGAKNVKVENGKVIFRTDHLTRFVTVASAPASTDKSPGTGDLTGNILMWIVLIIASFGAMATVLFRRRMSGRK